jgi:DNA-binding transcriptional LysR family regulator
MIAVRIGGAVRAAVVAAPDYLARHPRPRTLQDLAAHNCILIRLPSGATLPWTFEKNGQRVEAAVSGRLTVNDERLALRAAMDGAGVLYTPLDPVAPLIEEGRLVPLLEDWQTRAATLFLYYPSRRQVPAPLQAFIEFLRANVRAG